MPTVILTRDEESNLSTKKLFEEQLRCQNIQIISFPTLKFASNPALSADDFSEIESYDCYLFASKRAVMFFIDELRRHQKSLEFLADKTIACVGEITAAYCQEHLKFKSLINDKNSTLLSKLIMQRLPVTNRIMHMCGDLALVNFEKILGDCYNTFSKMVVYYNLVNDPDTQKLAELKELVKGNQQVFFTFFSPSSVRNAKELLGDILKAESVSNYAIGNTTAREIKHQLLELRGVAEYPTAEDMILLIKSEIGLIS